MAQKYWLCNYLIYQSNKTSSPQENFICPTSLESPYIPSPLSKVMSGKVHVISIIIDTYSKSIILSLLEGGGGGEMNDKLRTHLLMLPVSRNEVLFFSLLIVK